MTFGEWQSQMPQGFLHALSAGYGLIVGSFVNVLIARLPHDQSIVKPRSRCPVCEKQIAWHDNIPLLSYAWLRGKCRHCGMRISPRYPLVEFLTALLFVAADLRYGWSASLVLRDWPLLAILVAVTFIDLDHRIIPDELSLGGLALALLTCWMDPRIGWLEAIIGGAVGFGAFYAMAWLYERYAGRAGLGGGDIKLLAMLGAFLGPYGVLMTVLVSSVVGSLVGIGWALVQKRKEVSDVMSLAIPYGPFLVIGGLYYYFGTLWLPFTIPT